MLLGGGSPRSGQQRQQSRPQGANNENCRIDMNMEDPSRNLEVPSSSTVAQSSTSKASNSVTNSEASSNSAGVASQEYAEEEWKSHFSHDFVAKWFNRPTWCKYCGRYIWQVMFGCTISDLSIFVKAKPPFCTAANRQVWVRLLSTRCVCTILIIFIFGTYKSS